MWSFFPFDMIPKACHSDNGLGLILPSKPAFTPPWNFIREAWLDGDEILTSTFFMVSHGNIMRMDMANVSQISRRLRSIEKFMVYVFDEGS